MSKKAHVCGICGYATNRISNFKDHQNRKTPCKLKEFDKQYVIESEINQNDTFVNKNTDNFDVNVTNLKYEDTYFNDNDTKLYNSDTVKTFQCDKCDKCYTSKQNLTIHMKKCNGKVNKLQCQICLKIFNCRTSLYYHKKKALCEPPKQIEIEENEDDKIKKLEESLKLCEKENRLNKLTLKLLSLQKENDEIKNFISTGTIPMNKQTSKNQFTPSQKKTITFNQDYKCKICDILLPADFEIDHIIGIADGGTNQISNGQALCKPCHEKKTYQENTARKSLKKTMSIN